MKKNNMFQRMLIAVVCVTFLLLGAVVSFGQIAEAVEGKINEARITIQKGQLLQWTIDRPDKTTGFVIANPTDQFGAVDFGALDGEGNEVSRSTTEIEPHSRRRYTMPLEMFEGQQFDEVFTLNNVSSVWIQISLHPELVSDRVTTASLPIAFFSQKNSSWGSDQIGTCTKQVGTRVVKQTLAELGCAVSSVAMAGANTMSNLTPGTLNSYLKGVSGGYVDGCSIDWGKAANYDGTAGFKYYSSGEIKNAATLKSLIDSGYYVVAYSKRFEGINSTHWVVIYKYTGTGTSLNNFEYLDPIDPNYMRHTVGDVWVTAASRTRTFEIAHLEM